LHDVLEVLGYENLQTVLYYLKMSPLHIILCLLGFPHVVCLSGFTLVPLLRIIVADACVAIGHLVPMSPAIIFWGRVESSLPLSFCSLLFQKVLDVLQLVGAVLKLLGQKRV
jgi:hypothetical protein